MKRSSLIAFSLLALASRSYGDVRKVPSFNGIELAGTIVVEAHAGGASVDVVGDPDLVKLVSTTVKDGVLVIDTPKNFAQGKRNAKIKVIVSAPDLSRITISGTGTMAVDGLAAKSLDVSVPGTGELHLAGKTTQLKLVVAGTAEVRAKDLVAGVVDVNIPGTAEATLHATKSFDANVAGTAMVKVRGNPASVRKSVVGTAMIDVK